MACALVWPELTETAARTDDGRFRAAWNQVGIEPMADTAHIFTVDLEEYFQAHALGNVIGRSEWEYLPPRAEKSTRVLLDFLEERGFEATFFVLGWVADRNRELIEEIAGRGHEVASHGWTHHRVDQLSPEEFRSEVRRSKELLEELTGRPVRGYRAPSFSLVPGTEWAMEILAQEGFVYDSSVYPVRRPGYGYPGASTDPFRVDTASGSILELPPATLKVAGMALPAGGGAYFRHLPYELTSSALRQNGERDVPGVFYIHSWEIDEHMPRLPVGLIQELRHYGRIDRMLDRLDRLADEFNFTSVEQRYQLDHVSDLSVSKPSHDFSSPDRQSIRERVG